MSDEFISSTIPVETNENHNKFEKILKRALIVCGMLLAGELIWLLVVNPALPFSHIDIEGMENFDRLVILEKAGVTPHSSFFTFNAGEAQKALESIPQIASADISKQFPDTLKIVLHERAATAIALADVNGKTEIIVFDKNGVVFEVGKSGGLAIPASLPIISGMVFENPVVGMRLPEFLMPLLNDIYNLKEKFPNLLSVISEIYINKKTYDSYDLIVYPAHSQVKVRFGEHLKEDQLSYMLLMLDVLREKGLNVDEIDFRTGTASYTVKDLGEYSE